MKPISRRELIRRLSALGFNGPYPGGKHEYMRKPGKRIAIPNPHRGEIDGGLLAKILRDAEISREEWESVA